MLRLAEGQRGQGKRSQGALTCLSQRRLRSQEPVKTKDRPELLRLKTPEYASERISEDFMAATGRRSPKGWRTSCLEVAESKSHLKCAEVPMIA